VPSIKRRRLANAIAASLTLVVAAAAIAVSEPLWAFSVLGATFPGVVWRVKTSQHIVALSFDDGPSPQNTPKVLEILARHDAHATFFLIGDRAQGYPEYLDILRSAGHEVGNHYIGIGSTLHDEDEQFVDKLERTEKILRLGGPVKLFRPPGGKIRSSQLRLAEERGYRVVLGSAYPFDGAHPPASYIRWLVTKNLAPGVIVILHDGIRDPSRMIAVLDSILAEGDRRGFHFVTVGELLGGAR
jgi:peptidoglycan/xylan/chitin deacetylase (PgdA/CDA1 family)